MQDHQAPYVTLNNGNKFPQIGLGTFAADEGDAYKIVKEAILNHNYRAIDTASIYFNEEPIGNAL